MVSTERFPGRSPLKAGDHTMFLSTIASPPSLENRLMSRHMVPYARATQIVTQARANLLLASSSPTSSLSTVTTATTHADLQAECEHVMHQQKLFLSPLQRDGLFISVPRVLSHNHAMASKKEPEAIQDNCSERTCCDTFPFVDVFQEGDDNIDLDKEQKCSIEPKSSRQEDYIVNDDSPKSSSSYNRRTRGLQASLRSTEAIMDVSETSSSSDLHANTAINSCCGEQLTFGNHSSTEEKMQQNAGRVIAVSLPSIRNAPSAPCSGAVPNNDSDTTCVPQHPTSSASQSLVNTASSTVTVMSGATVPSVVFILRRSLVPLDEPLEMPHGVLAVQHKPKTGRANLFQRLRGTLRRSDYNSPNCHHNTTISRSIFLSELDSEVFERTLVQI